MKISQRLYGKSEEETPLQCTGQVLLYVQGYDADVYDLEGKFSSQTAQGTVSTVHTVPPFAFWGRAAVHALLWPVDSERNHARDAFPDLLRYGTVLEGRALAVQACCDLGAVRSDCARYKLETPPRARRQLRASHSLALSISPRHNKSPDLYTRP